MKTRYKDKLGQDIYEGDIILYSTKSGTGGVISCFKVVGQTAERLKVKRTCSYTGKTKVTYLTMPSEAIVITNQLDPEAVFNKMNNVKD